MKFLSRSALALALGITAASVTPSELAAQSAQIGENNIFCALVSGAVVSSDSNAPIAGAAISLFAPSDKTDLVTDQRGLFSRDVHSDYDHYYGNAAHRLVRRTV
jgi:hypothetical protein